jgi:hypothetical protein
MDTQACAILAYLKQYAKAYNMLMRSEGERFFSAGRSSDGLSPGGEID